MRRELTIDRLGSKGDGIAETDDGPVFVPFALPGEDIVADVEGERAHLLDIRRAAPERAEPVCQHFGECGGCVMQHLDWSRYLDWKRERVIEALNQEGIEADMLVEPVRAFGPHTRRRASFAAVKSGHAVTLGFRRALSHEIIDLAECPVLLPRFEAVIPGLRALLMHLLPDGESRIVVTACDNGFDVGIESSARGLGRLSPKIGQAAEALGVVRITAGRDPIFTLAAPQVTLAGVRSDLPPGAFLQASGEAEAAMTEFAVGVAGRAKKVADLFCGLGAFAFALARRAAVTAIDNDRILMAALDAAARRAQGIKPMTMLTRDLMRDPLSPLELNRFDAVLFDPPRAGAQAQAKALAKSRVQKIAAASCNPVTFARDARILVDGGYALVRVVPIDQFVYSAHVELVAEFVRQ